MDSRWLFTWWSKPAGEPRGQGLQLLPESGSTSHSSSCSPCSQRIGWVFTVSLTLGDSSVYGSLLLEFSQDTMGLSERAVGLVLSSSYVNARRLSLFRTAHLVLPFLQQPWLAVLPKPLHKKADKVSLLLFQKAPRRTDRVSPALDIWKKRYDWPF